MGLDLFPNYSDPHSILQLHSIVYANKDMLNYILHANFTLFTKIYMNKCHKKGSYVEYLNKYNFMAHGFASLKLK